MTKSKKVSAAAAGQAALSHHEIWDDKLLLDTWNAALKEYKKYHSLHTHGITPSQALAAYDAAIATGTEDPVAAAFAHPSPPPAIHARAAAANPDPTYADYDEGDYVDHDASASAPAAQSGPVAPVPGAAVPGAAVPGAVLQSGPVAPQDEAMKNLLMAWYYAGYYTGVHEGKQMGAEDAEKKAQGKAQGKGQGQG